MGPVTAAENLVLKFKFTCKTTIRQVAMQDQTITPDAIKGNVAVHCTFAQFNIPAVDPRRCRASGLEERRVQYNSSLGA